MGMVFFVCMLMIIIVANLAWDPAFSYPLLTQQQYISPRDILPGTHSPWLILDWCYLGMYPVGEGFWQNFYNLVQSWSILFIFLAANWKVYTALLKLVRGVYSFFPLLMPMSEAFLFFHFSKFSAAQSSEWLRLCLWFQSESFFEYHEFDTSHCKISLCISVK